MSTPIPVAGDNLDSASKLNLMLEALSKASSELEKTVNVLTEQLTTFNTSLDKQLKDEVQLARERMDSVLRQNQEGLIKDKEAVVKALAEFKQAEIEKVILSGKTVRTGLAAQVEDATRALTETVSSKLVGIKEHFAQPELEMKRKYDDLAAHLEAAVTDAQGKLTQTRISEENWLGVTANDFDGKLVQSQTERQQNLDHNFTMKRSELEAQGEKVVAALAQKYDEVIGRLDGSYQEGLASANESNEQAANKLKQLSDSGLSVFAEQDQSYKETLASLSKLLNGLFETRLNNLAAQSRTEIVSAATHAEECLTTTKAELHVCLIEFQRDYVVQFEALHTRLEKTLDEYCKPKDSNAMRGLKEDRVKEHLHSLFRRLGQEMIDSAANASRALEAEFQKSMDAFEQRIETAKGQACESLTRESNLMKNELTRSSHEFDKQVLDLHTQAARLEKAGQDPANFVMTIRQANLDF